MPAATVIKYLKHEEVDKSRWDACIEAAGNGLIYAYSFYLDQMSSNWDALVLNDYEAVMPLTWRKKFGIYYLYQPFLTPQLGVIGTGITDNNVEQFIKLIPRKFQFWEINLNRKNLVAIDGFHFKTNTNHYLNLDKPFELVVDHYNQNVKRNLKKAAKAECFYKEGIPLKEVISLAVHELNAYTRVTSKDILNFENLCEYLIKQGKAIPVGVYKEEKLLASSILLIDNKTAFYILAATSAEGKRTGASHFLVDQFIKNHAGRISTLDFAGSNISSIAFFYESFGAEHYRYPSLRVNRMPLLLKWIKR